MDLIVAEIETRGPGSRDDDGESVTFLWTERAPGVR